MFRRFHQNAAGTEAPSGGQPAPVTPPPAPPAVVATPAAPVVDENPPWLKGRLEQAERALLTGLGITDPAKAKEVIAAANKAEEDAKTAAQKLGETSKTLESEKARADRLEGVVKERAAHELATLKPEQQAAVRAIAPDADPAAQLRAITALTPTWAIPAAPAAPPPATPPAPPAAGTAPPPAAPPPAGTVSPPDRKAEYLALKAKNPHAAALFLNQHHAAIYPHP